MSYTEQQYKAQDYGPPGHMPQQVIVQQPHSIGVVKTPWSWCTMVTAVFGLCCCTLFGFIAVLQAILSYVDHKSGDMVRSRHKKSCSLGFGITAIVLGSITLVGIIVLYSMFWDQMRTDGYYGK